MGRFDGKVALITGASSGIGEALARELAGQGAAVALVARRVERLQALAADIASRGGRAVAIAGDVAADGDMERAVATAVDHFGGLDVVVANAGFGVAGRLEKLTIEDYRRQLETNVFGVLRTVFASLPELKRRRGTLALVGSVAGFLPGPGTSAYALSKAAVHSLAKSLRGELGAHGIGVVLISPGFVASEIRRVDNQGVLREQAPDPIPRWLQMPADKAARAIARAIARRKREAIITFHGKLAVFLERFTPWLVARVVGKVKRRPSDPEFGA
jgi:short-subunit dehydrogenase